MPLSAGTVYVDVKPNTTAMTSKGGGLTGAMKTAGVLAAGAFAVSFVKNSIEAGKDVEKHNKMIAASFGRTKLFDPEVVTAQFDKVNQYMGQSVQEMQKRAAVFNDAIDFSQFGDKAEEMLVGMTTATADVAAMTGKSSTMIQKQMVKLGTSPEVAISIFKDLGVVTGEQEAKVQKLVAAGKDQEAAQLAINAVMDKSAGAAKKNTTTTEVLAGTWDELQEMVGTKLLPVVNFLAEKMTTVISLLTNGSGATKAFLSVLGALVAVMIALKVQQIAVNAAMFIWNGLIKTWTALQKVGTAVQWAWNAAMSANPIGLIVIAVIALIALIVVLWKKNETFRKIVLAVWGAVKKAFVTTWDAIKTAAMAVFNFLKSAVMAYFRVYNLIFQKVWGATKAAFDKIVGVVKTAWGIMKGVFNGAKDVVTGIWDAYLSAAKTAFNAIANLWNSTVGKLSFNIPDWVPKIGGNGWDVPDIPVLHKGGVFNSGNGEGLALLKDGETVLPTSDGLNGMTLRIVDSNLGLVMDAAIDTDKRYGETRGRANR